MGKNTQDLVFGSKRFGGYLRRLRANRRFLLAEIGQMSVGMPAQVTKSHLSRLENGLPTASFARMCTLSMIYDVPISTLADQFRECFIEQPLQRDEISKAADDGEHATGFEETTSKDKAIARRRIVLNDRRNQAALDTVVSGTTARA